mmetsp:Transcript_42366/g.106796  ORF Transcript_42366/g.106796 Transcript_42366/m.106796 type:complete len:273 (+) Transcript_42366:1776-2594(+)
MGLASVSVLSFEVRVFIAGDVRSSTWDAIEFAHVVQAAAAELAACEKAAPKRVLISCSSSELSSSSSPELSLSLGDCWACCVACAEGSGSWRLGGVAVEAWGCGTDPPASASTPAMCEATGAKGGCALAGATSASSPALGIEPLIKPLPSEYTGAEGGCALAEATSASSPPLDIKPLIKPLSMSCLLQREGGLFTGANLHSVSWHDKQAHLVGGTVKRRQASQDSVNLTTAAPSFVISSTTPCVPFSTLRAPSAADEPSQDPTSAPVASNAS